MIKSAMAKTEGLHLRSGGKRCGMWWGWKMVFGFMILGWTGGCSSRMHTVEFINDSQKMFEISVEGIGLSPQGKGPKTLNGHISPQWVLRWFTGAPSAIFVDYPVKIFWREEGKKEWKMETFDHIEGVPFLERKLGGGGTVVVGLDSQAHARIFFVGGEVNQTKKHYEILKKPILKQRTP